MSRPVVTRRLFLAIASLFVVLGPERTRAAQRSEVSRLAALFRRRESARAVGRAYLRECPEEASPERLVTALKMSDEAFAEYLEGPEDTERLRTAVRSRIQRDFAGGRTVWVERFLLSRTEARLCALALFT